MTTQAEQNTADTQEILKAELRGELDYEQANEKLQVVVDRINMRGKEIAKKYGRSYSNVTVGYLRRATDIQ